MKDKARLLVTLNCSRSCSYCPNQHEHIMSQAIRIKNVGPLSRYREVMISGGEPLLNYDTTMKVIDDLGHGNGYQHIYLYTSIWQRRMVEVLSKIDGIQYTLHQNASAMDVNDFEMFQEDMRGFPTLSYRLAVIKSVDNRIVIKSRLWDQVVFKPPRLGKDCIVPESEDLFVWEE